MDGMKNGWHEEWMAALRGRNHAHKVTVQLPVGILEAHNVVHIRFSSGHPSSEQPAGCSPRKTRNRGRLRKVIPGARGYDREVGIYGIDERLRARRLAAVMRDLQHIRL